MTAALVAGLTGAMPSAHALPAFDEVRRQTPASDAVLLDRHGRELQRLRVDMQARRGEWVALEDISPALRSALVFSEDRRFYAHSGVDWRSVGAAAWGKLWHTRTRGASTLTMQLAGLLDEDLRVRSGGRTLTQKLGQAVTATRLERAWRKDEILEAYLNLVPFRGEIVGLSALSQVMFGKHPHGLDEREAAIAVALLRAPNAAAKQVTARACAILGALQPAAGCATLDGQTEIALASVRAGSRPSVPVAGTGDAPHLARRMFAQLAAQPGQRIGSTLDAGLQRFARDTLVRQLRAITNRNVEDGAVVVLDNSSGEVLAWVGSSGTLSSAAEVDGVTALRQAGSTLKPFLYGQAIAERRITAASLLHDAPLRLQTGNGLYVPQNYDRGYAGWVSARTALGASLNIPAVLTLQMVSPRRFAQQLTALGLPLKRDGDFYGYSLALGSAEVTLLSLTNAYRALANGGRYAPARWTTVAPDAGTAAVRAAGGAGRNVDAAGRNVNATGAGAGRAPVAAIPQPLPHGAGATAMISADAAWIVSDILADRHARVRTFGLDSVLDTRFWSAVKTGTSKDMRDNWCIGYSRRYTVGVWVGNASGASMHGVSGVSGAAPVWHEVLAWLHARDGQVTRQLAPTPAPGIVTGRIRFSGEVEPARDEWFLAGTEQTLIVVETAVSGSARHGKRGGREQGGERRGSPPAESSGASPSQAASGGPPRIVGPVDGAIHALDPDIPPDHQRIWFEANRADVSWRLDGKAFGRGARIGWLPWPGRHVIELLDARGKVVERVGIEVRGAGIRADARASASAPRQAPPTP